jgi:Retrotransposon gag protein
VQRPTPVTVHGPKEIKMSMPDLYHGDRAKLKVFLMQSELWLGFNADTLNFREPQKVLWATSYMRGRAFAWIETFASDHLMNLGGPGVEDTRDDDTKALFDSWRGFKAGIMRMFGDIDEEHTAERKLLELRQKGPVTAYAAEFQQLAFKTSFGDGSLAALFYKGLKDSVKDEMAHSDRPKELPKMVEDAIRYDNRLYERALERKGHYHIPTNGKKSKERNSWPQPMELDATQKKSFKQKPRLPKEEMERRRRDRLCFECRKEGH